MTRTALSSVDRPITINADMGEGIAIHSFGNDDALLAFVDTINLACGMHAGGPSEMSATVDKALAAGVSIGAHPGLPDLQGFGRRVMALDPDEVRDLVLYQVGALSGFLLARGASLHHIKPHGALYEMATKNESHMEAICDVAEIYGVPVLGLPATGQERVAERRGIPFLAEFYVDLDYDDDAGVIVARKAAPRDLDQVEERTRHALERGEAISVNGTRLAIHVDSLCVHSDIPNAPEVAERIRSIVDSHLAQLQGGGARI